MEQTGFVQWDKAVGKAEHPLYPPPHFDYHTCSRPLYLMDHSMRYRDLLQIVGSRVGPCDVAIDGMIRLGTQRRCSQHQGTTGTEVQRPAADSEI